MKIFGVGFTPLLAFQSPAQAMRQEHRPQVRVLMSYDARMASSITPSSLFRVVDEYRRLTHASTRRTTFSRDEKTDLLGILNAGRDKLTAKVMRAESVGDGKFKVREFNTFAPIALTSIKRCPARFRIAPSCCRSSARRTASGRSG